MNSSGDLNIVTVLFCTLPVTFSVGGQGDELPVTRRSDELPLTRRGDELCVTCAEELVAATAN